MTEGKEETTAQEENQEPEVAAEAVEALKEPEMPEGVGTGERLISEGNEPLGASEGGQNGGLEGVTAAPEEAPLPVAEEVPEPPAEPAASPETPAPAPIASVPPAPAPAPSIVRTSREYMRTLMQKAREKISFRTAARLEKIMHYLEEHEHITNDDVEKLLRVSDATATRYLQALEQQKKIIQEGITGGSVRYRKA